MSLIQSLPSGPLDIIGDIHGEYVALCSLLLCLGYDLEGAHPDGRTLVFVGDFCDRGPDSPSVLRLVERLVKAGRAVAVLGNHEINLLREDAKDGSGWFFDEREERDQENYAPFVRPGPAEKASIVAFLSTLPIALERSDLRVIHAAWITTCIEDARVLPAGTVRHHYDTWDAAAKRHAKELLPQMANELADWGHSLENPLKEPPPMPAHAEFETVRQMMNPLKVLTAGVERKETTPFYSGGKWRFVGRVQWWNDYDEDVPVVVGHYWRRFRSLNKALALPKGANSDLFVGVAPHAWHGKRSNVFCVDFSVGRRYTARKARNLVVSDFKLAALQWPERILRFDDGQAVVTEGFRRITSTV